MSDLSDAEFDRDRAALDAALEKIPGWDGTATWTDDPDDQRAASDLIAQFFTKHRLQLEAEGIPASGFLREFATKRKMIDANRLAADAIMECLLHTGADLAEARARLIKHEYRMLKHWEKWTSADWAKLSPDKQAELREIIKRFRDEMPELLASLPIEKRRELEELD